MATPQTSLTDLLTAAANALAGANTRLAARGAPAMLHDMDLTLMLAASPSLRDSELWLPAQAEPSLQQKALPSAREMQLSTTIQVRVMAAPAIKPAPKQEA